jgi:hypothetical protein
MRKAIFAIAIALSVIGAGAGIASILSPTPAVAGCSSRC